MSHENLPALRKYTSQVQYDALKSIEETKSSKTLVFSGSSSRTLGALVRSAWINTFPYVEDGIKHEGWCVTEAGKHAMNMFEEQQRLETIKEEKAKVRIDKYVQLIIAEYELELTHRPEIERLALERQKLIDELREVQSQRSSSEWGLTPYDKHRAMDAAKQYYKNKQLNGGTSNV